MKTRNSIKSYPIRNKMAKFIRWGIKEINLSIIAKIENTFSCFQKS